ncbi:Phenylacetic acid catabolic protein [Caballeronia sp. M23-90]
MFADCTPESRGRWQAALDCLVPYTRELFSVDDVERAIADAGIGLPTANLQDWPEDVTATVAEATLKLPADVKHVSILATSTPTIVWLILNSPVGFEDLHDLPVWA